MEIFAKYGTDEKVVIDCSQGQVRNTQLALAKKYGGEWSLVDFLHQCEILHFTDGLTYLGFHGKNERYCKAIDILK